MDKYIERLVATGQLTRRFDALVGKAGVGDFATDIEQQASVLYDVARIFPHMAPGAQQRAINAFFPYVERAKQDPNPGLTLKRILELPSQQDIYRTLRVGVTTPRPFVADEDELIYPQDGWMGAYLRYARNNQCNLGFHFWGILGITGAVAQRKLYLDMGQFRIYLNTYTILTGDSSSGKSIARSIACDLLERYNRRIVQMDPNTTDDVNILPRNCTPAFLAETLSNRPFSRVTGDGVEEVGFRDATGILVLDELATFLNKGAHGIDEKVPMLVELQDAKVYDKATVQKGAQYLYNCGLSILGLAAPEWFKDSITPAVRKGGLMDRILFVHRNESSRVYTLPLDPLDPLVAEELVTDMLTWGRLRDTVLQPTPAGQRYMNKFHVDFTKMRKMFPNRSDYEKSRNRYIVMVWRVAALLSLTYGNAPNIEEDHLHLAQKLLQLEDTSTETLMEATEEGPDADMFQRIESYLARKDGCATHREMVNNFYKRVRENSGGLRYFTKTLEEAGRVVRVPLGKGHVYRLADHTPCPKCRSLLSVVQAEG